jgi:chitodextrinase
LNKVAIPQADEQQRLLANLMVQMTLDRKPLPRFWYFPRGEKAVVIMTGDDHGNNGTTGRWNDFLAASPAGCSVENWECVRGTSYMYPSTPMTNARAADFEAQGFEVGLHVNTNCADYDRTQLEQIYTRDINAFSIKWPSAPRPTTQRHHCIAWTDWATAAKVQSSFGVRLDTSYYFWPPGWVLNRPGFFSGSALPMRFADLDGTLINVYQAATQMTDESGQQYPFTVDTLLDRALGNEGYYGAYVVNAHTDLAVIPESTAVVDSALRRDVPIITSRQMLEWLDGRDSSSFRSIVWNGATLGFEVAAGEGANGLQALVPLSTAAGVVGGVTRNGASTPYEVVSRKGIEYASFTATSGTYEVSYAEDTTAPSVVSRTPADGSTGVSRGTLVSAVFSKSMDAATITTATFQLRGSSGDVVAATVDYSGDTRTATLTPSSALSAETVYTATLSSGITDLSGNTLAADVSWSFTTEPPLNCPCSVWDDTDTPTTASASDPNAVELGVKLRSDLDGFITGVRFYKGTLNTGTHTGSLWTADGTRLATATFTNETATGWQQVDFANPVPISANTVYVASYYAPNGGYAVDSNYFAGSGVAKSPLYFLSNVEGGGNGVYRYGASGFPNQSWNASNYWVDVVFSDTGGSGPGDTTPPTVTSTTPADGAAGVAVTTAPTAVFSEAMDAATITTATFALRSQDGSAVAATLSYDEATRTATLTPQSALTAETQYTATLQGGAGGVADLAGNALAQDYSWSFATAPAGSGVCATPCSLWDGAATPSLLADPDTSPVELGVKFRSDVDGFVTGLRFYKSTQNTGTHVGSLWSSSGQLLAEATFVDETASGWQQVDLPAPVAIQAGVTYVASYHTTVGRYSVDENYFASAFTNGPLRGLADGESGGNGVYLYGARGFPTNSFRASNYWVDVVFSDTGGSGPGDTTPPTVTSTTPADGAAGVAVTTAPTAVFSEAMDAATITTATFELRDAADTLVPAAVSYVTATQTATLTPSSLLAAGTTYSATVKGGPSGVKDSAGNALAADVGWSFTTGTAADTTPPTVTSTTPADGAAGVAVTTAPTAVFSEAMDAATITTATFALRSQDGSAVAATLSYDEATRTATLTPQSALTAETQYTATLQGGAGGVADLAGNALAQDYSWSFATAPAGSGVCATPCSLWDGAATPSLLADPDTSPVELGVKFRSDVDGFVTGLRFYKSTQNTGTHVGSLWSSSGQLLAEATFVDETASGWQQVDLPAPVAIQAGVTYVASYHTTVGRYSVDENYFASAFTNGPLRGLADGESGGNGVYLYGARGFPTNSFRASNYWVDVVFSDTGGSGPGDTTPPTVTSTTPADGAAGVAVTTAPTVVFSEAMDAATITTATFALRSQDGSAVAATLSYDEATRTATLTPQSALTAETQYTATLQGGAGGVADLAGNALAQDYSWSFATAPAGSGVCATPCSLWDGAATPSLLADPDTSPVELGVKFRSDVDGFVTGLRFYKSTQNTGTHVGSLWSSSGQLLAEATFVDETASGWQQVDLPAPVAIQAGVTYVASYHTTVGRYSVDENYFASAFTNGPLRGLADGESGGNGVYLYGARGFPTNSFRASNYWVDVVMTTSVGPDTKPPLVSTTAPLNDAADVSTLAEVRATFNEPMDPTTINGSSFELRGAESALIGATVTYDAATRTATLKPNNPLSVSTRHSATVRGGTSGVKDLAGNALVSDVTWSFTTAGSDDPCGAPANAIVAENCLAGNPASEWDISGAGDTSIQGFATDISVDKGEIVDFKINTPASRYRLDIYRMGYYGGDGARKVATVLPSATLPQSQPSCLTQSSTGLVDCGNWGVSASWPVPVDATSGIYFAKAIREDTGGASHIVFIVRDDSGRSDLLFQTADTTWQAYNSYGGNFIEFPDYGYPTTRAFKGSYNRPFWTRNRNDGLGSFNWLFHAEYPMVRWLEANGYDVSYFTGVDSDLRGDLIRNHKVFLSVGHDEYWSGRQRENVEAARDAGVSLAFFSGNAVYRKIRWETSLDASGTPYRTMVCYKESNAEQKIDPLPDVWTGSWRDGRFSPPADGGLPENALMGTLFSVVAVANDGISLRVPEADGKMRLWRNTPVASLASGQTATLGDRVLGYEFDEDIDNGFRPPGLVRLSSTTTPASAMIVGDNIFRGQDVYPSGTATHSLTLYKHSSGALVFGAGTVQWSWGLDGEHDNGRSVPDNSIRQATVNLFADMGVQPATLQSGLVAARASTDAVAPTSAVTSPTSGTNLPVGSAVQIRGTATDVGGVVGAVEVSVDGGATWRPAAGRANWSYTWTPTESGFVTIRSRAADDSGNLETPGPGIGVSVGTVTDTTPPTAPTGLTASAAGAAAIALSWGASTDNVGVAGYRVERCSGSGCSNFTEVATVTGTSYEDSGLTASTLYRYRVRAADAAGNLSAYSAIAEATTGSSADTTPPTAPTGLTASAAGAAAVALSWGASTDNVGVAGYRVERCSGSGCSNFTEVATVTGTSYEDSGLTASTLYRYRVRAADAAGNLSAYSAIAEATTGSSADTTPPTAPTGLTASAAGAAAIALSWGASTDNVGVAGYRVERCSGSGCSNFTEVATVTGTSYEDSGLTASTLYRYRVRAADAAGNLSAYSAIAEATTGSSADTTPPTAPTGLTASAAGAAAIALSWGASTDNVGVSGYRVERCTGSGCSNFTEVATVTGTSYEDSGLTAFTVYRYRVRAADAAGNLSSYSNVVRARTARR